MKRVVFITPPDALYGFLLAGVTHYATGVDEAWETIRKVVREPETGLVVVDERLARDITQDQLREVGRGWTGILLMLPSPVKPSVSEEDYALRLIRRAIGYHVKLKL